MARAKGALSNYCGKQVLKAGVSLRNAGDGLSKSLAIEPIELPIGSEGYILVKYTTKGHQHSLIPDMDAYELKLILMAGTGTLVDAEWAEQAIEAQELKLEQAAGIQRLPMGETNTDEMVAKHEAGEHAEATVAGCPPCDAEVAAISRERRPRRARKSSEA